MFDYWRECPIFILFNLFISYTYFLNYVDISYIIDISIIDPLMNIPVFSLLNHTY